MIKHKVKVKSKDGDLLRTIGRVECKAQVQDLNGTIGRVS